jgi:glycosyltransferase involved in cell wall biosynthesis
MLRVVFDDEIFTAQFVGGASRIFCELGEALARRGDIVPVMHFPLTANRHLAVSPMFQGHALDRYRGVPGLRRLMRAFNRRAVFSVLDRGEADIVHATWYDTKLVKRAGNAPVVMTVHDMLPELMPDIGVDAAHGAKLAVIPHAHRIVAVSETTAKALCRLTGLSRDVVRVIHHGISDGLRWRPADRRPSQLPQSFLLFVGRRDGYKNFRGVAASVAQLLRRDAAMHLVCVGAGSLHRAEIAPFESAGVARRVLQIEADDRLLAACYAHAVAFLFPSLYEGFGLPLLEAMINRCPVISSNGGALPEIADEAALYFDPAHPEAIVDLVEGLSRDRARRDALVARGLRRAANFSWDRAAALHADLYRELIGRPGGAPTPPTARDDVPAVHYP